jgi:hypothetical protein
MSFQIPNADALVTYVQEFTGSTNRNEIKQCIYLAELMLRNVELPIQRTDPFAPENIAVADTRSRFPIPKDMNKPVLFFQTQNTFEPTNEATGPWIIYDRIGDRDILALSLIQQFYLAPINIPAVMRGKFSEVGDQYQLVPRVAEGTLIHMYYYKAFDLLFTPYIDRPGYVQMNGVLATFPEGYIYGTLHNYYLKRHIPEDAQLYKLKFDEAVKTVVDQNDLGKWSGGTTRMTSVYSPRRGNYLAPK